MRFDGAIFPDGISFEEITFSQSTYFRGAKFHGKTSFENAKFHGEKTSFMLAKFYGEKTWFWATEFHGKVSFIGEQPGKIFLNGIVYFVNIIFGDEGNLVFDWVDLSRTRFLQTDLSKIKFLDVTWARPSNWNWKKISIRRWGLWRNGLYDEICWRNARNDPKSKKRKSMSSIWTILGDFIDN